MPLPTCQCNAGLPPLQQLSNIYCALDSMVLLLSGGSEESPLARIIDTGNSTFTALGANETFTGVAVDANTTGATFAVKSDVDGTLFVDQSSDGVTWESTLTFNVTGGSNEVHRITLTRRYMRVRYLNGADAQGTMSLQTILGNFFPLSSPLNSVAQDDADALITRSITEESMTAEGKYQGRSIVNKFGTKTGISMATTVDIWEGTGTYTGFPASGEPLRAVSTSVNDTSGGTGAERIQVQAMTTDYEWVQVTFILNGLTPVAPSAPYASTNFIRCHTATVSQSANGANTGVNAGTITVYQATTTTNIFLNMVVGRNQTNCSAYTIPAGYTGYMRSISAAYRAASSGTADGFIWTRSFGRPFRSRRPFSFGSAYTLQDKIYGGLVFTEKSDIVLRLSGVSANNTSVNGAYDLLLVKNT